MGAPRRNPVELTKPCAECGEDFTQVVDQCEAYICPDCHHALLAVFWRIYDEEEARKQ